MKNECCIVRDLLPLSVENMVSEETAEFMKEHIENCPGCRAEKEKLADTLLNHLELREEHTDDRKTLKKIRTKIRTKKIFAAVISSVLSLLIACVLGYYAMYVGIPMEFDENVIDIEKGFDKNSVSIIDEKPTLEQNFYLQVNNIQGKGMIAETKGIFDTDESGETTCFTWEITFRKPLIDIGQNPVLREWNCSTDFTKPEGYDEKIRLIFSDRVFEFSMREEGLFEQHDDIKNP